VITFQSHSTFDYYF